MGKKKLDGTVPRYDRHILLCYQNSEAWPPWFHKSKLDTFLKLFINHVSHFEFTKFWQTMVTICESIEGTGYDEGDVLIFPDMIKYKRLKDSYIGEFIDDVLVKDVPWASGVQEKLTGCHIFVCAHGSLHEIYRLCAPILIEKLNEVVEARGLQGQVYVSGCSDVYGPEYAPNLIVYRSDSEGRVTGHWYGHVTPRDVPYLLVYHFGKGEVILHKLRFVILCLGLCSLHFTFCLLSIW
ncbi:unnamed protein product [Linum tenue]|uniref:Uncharacterized protein n=1 Tax=Linum tenue TaxID=586396 RepID=A0AAV0L6X3_9ROSI|nr:unnamed protein product [Linum tenue]